MKTQMIFTVILALLGSLIIPLTVGAAEGDTLWTRTYGDTSFAGAKAVIETSGGGYLMVGGIASLYTEDLYAVRTNVQGDTIWTSRFGDEQNTEEGSAVVETPSGDFLIVGGTYPGFGPSGDLEQMLLVKLSGAGDTLWSRTYGGTGDEWGYSLVATSEGNYLLAGSSNSYGTGSNDMYLVKVDPDGNVIWDETYGGNNAESAKAVIRVEGDNYLLAGYSSADVYLVKINANGDILWTHTYGGSGDEEAYSAVFTQEGCYLVAGYTTSGVESGVDALLLKVNTEGNTIWMNSYDYDWDWEVARSVIQTDNGEYLLTGTTYHLSTIMQSDMFLMKIDTTGVLQWSDVYGGMLANEGLSVIQTAASNYLLAGFTMSLSGGIYDMYAVCVEGPVPGGVIHDSPLSPGEFTLHPPHPNPFNPTTVISFELRVPSYVKLEVFDVNGRSVGAKHFPNASPLSGSGATPTTGGAWYPAGAHQITFDGSNLPSGIYFAKLTAGEFSQVQKLVLLK